MFAWEKNSQKTIRLRWAILASRSQ